MNIEPFDHLKYFYINFTFSIWWLRFSVLWKQYAVDSKCWLQKNEWNKERNDKQHIWMFHTKSIISVDSVWILSFVVIRAFAFCLFRSHKKMFEFMLIKLDAISFDGRCFDWIKSNKTKMKRNNRWRWSRSAKLQKRLILVATYNRRRSLLLRPFLSIFDISDHFRWTNKRTMKYIKKANA